MTRCLCAWVSRHPPLPEHRADLRAYKIHQVSARETRTDIIWMDILLATGFQLPDLVVLITRHEQYTPMVLHLAKVAPATVVIRPLMQKDDRNGEWYWSGQWKRYFVVERRPGQLGTLQQAWTPEVEERA